MGTLNWKSRGDGRYDALASRVVGGKYFIQYQEDYWSKQSGSWVETRNYSVDYQTRGGGGIGNVDNLSILTLEQVKALAEADHQKRKELISKYGDLCNVSYEAWSQFRREMLALQGYSDAQF
jgi:hypothetical protein